MSGEVFYGWSVRRSEGSQTAKGIVGRRRGDGRMFLLLFRTALNQPGYFNYFPGNEFYAGSLGPGTIVGSAAFNLFIIIGICIYVIPGY